MVLLFTGLTALQAYMSLTTMEQATGIPQTFPDDHNQDSTASESPELCSAVGSEDVFWPVLPGFCEYRAVKSMWAQL